MFFQVLTKRRDNIKTLTSGASLTSTLSSSTISCRLRQRHRALASSVAPATESWLPERSSVWIPFMLATDEHACTRREGPESVINQSSKQAHTTMLSEQIKTIKQSIRSRKQDGQSGQPASEHTINQPTSQSSNTNSSCQPIFETRHKRFRFRSAIPTGPVPKRPKKANTSVADERAI